jgi:hypothetical protein
MQTPFSRDENRGSKRVADADPIFARPLKGGLTAKCEWEYVSSCVLFDATAGYPFFIGQLVGITLNPASIASVNDFSAQSLKSTGYPSVTRPLLSPSGRMRLVAKTAALPVWQKHRVRSKDASSSRR